MNESTKKLKLEEQIALFLKKIGITFNKEKVLGKGSFGEIYEVVDQFGRIFAMKNCCTSIACANLLSAIS